ncbi:hypothetical protein HXX76_007702 [Chlamydomonas incerta]|uniref:Uncharacterized protein n=1 Tax=Chlamydomonas incerta TaxID=51695 RepID=A0A835VZA6_CHLIN|nr:hypothetical protein HXX76_007702 [Chlamydomonas incerta]|eukprot:KAG2434817.1 hypothetical protein HXX76_007702 [Chlamydomonas incerta]
MTSRFRVAVRAARTWWWQGESRKVFVALLLERLQLWAEEAARLQQFAEEMAALAVLAAAAEQQEALQAMTWPPPQQEIEPPPRPQQQQQWLPQQWLPSAQDMPQALPFPHFVGPSAEPTHQQEQWPGLQLVVPPAPFYPPLPIQQDHMPSQPSGWQGCLQSAPVEQQPLPSFTLWEGEQPDQPPLLQQALQAGDEDQPLQEPRRLLFMVALAATASVQQQQRQQAEHELAAAAANAAVAAEAARQKQARKEERWRQYLAQAQTQTQPQAQLPYAEQPAACCAARWSVCGGSDNVGGSGSSAAGEDGTGRSPNATTPPQQYEPSTVQLASTPQEPHPQQQCQSRRRHRGGRRVAARYQMRQRQQEREQEREREREREGQCEGRVQQSKRHRGRRGGAKEQTRRARKWQGQSLEQQGGSCGPTASPPLAASRPGGALPKTPPHPTALIALLLARQRAGVRQ